jgi:hypothetical protein
MSLHGGLSVGRGQGRGRGRRLLAATSVMVLGLVMGAGPSVADDPVTPVTDVAAAAQVTTDATAPPVATDVPAPPVAADVPAPPVATDVPAPLSADVPAPPAPTDVAGAPAATTTEVITTAPQPSKKLAAAGTTTPLTVTAGAICPTTGQVTPHFTPGGFEIDGNCQSDGLLDWNSSAVGTQPKANDGLLPGADSTSFVANPGKSDVQYVYAYTHGDNTALWLDFAFTRPADTGSVAYELELNQSDAINAGVPVRTLGDWMFRITQNGNGNFALDSVQQWTASGWGTDQGTSGLAAAANAEGSFFEIALNLTTLIHLQPSCPPSAVFTALNMRTHTSPSQSSALADYIAPITITPPNNCPNLTLNKTVVGGTAAATDWTLTAHTTESSVPAAFATVSGTTGVTGPVVPANAYALSESGPSSYAGSLWTCTGGTLSGSLGSQTVTLGSASVSCSITNTALSSLTVHKTDLAGAPLGGATFVLHSGTPGGTVVGSCTTAALTGTCSVSGLGFGTYYWVETVAPAGYLLPTGSDAVFGPITIGENNAGTTIAATPVTDTPQTHLTLVKTVSNTWGGTSVPAAWTLAASGGPTTGITGRTGEPAVTNVLVSPGTYALAESGGPSGYEGTWSCTGATLGANDRVTVTVGQSATCTVNNSDLPARLTLVKTVVNVFGGTALDTAWTLTATGPTPAVLGRTGISGTTGATAVTNAPVAAGTYTLSESGPGGYDASVWSCTNAVFSAPNQVTLALGQPTTCTITNTAQPAHLTLVKAVVNAHGGTAINTAWTLTAAGPTPFSGVTGTPAVTSVAVNAGTYTLSESGPSGYVGTWSCPFASFTAPDQLTLAPGQAVTCTITNTDQAAHLTLVKTVVNAHGGTAINTAWTLTAGGPTPLTGVTGTSAVTAVAVNAGTYTLSESGGPAGYSASAWVCTAGTLDGASLTLALNQSATCTITNTDQAAHLTLVKTVVNTHGGTALNTAWTLAAGGPTPLTGVTGTSAVTAVAVNAGTYTLSESGGPAGYSPSAWVCTAGTLEGASLTLALNQSATCTITNTDQAAHLTLLKTVVNTHGGTALASAWTLAAAGPTPFSGTTGTNAVVNAGTYTLSESGGPSGYGASAWVCTAGTLDGASLTLALNQSATCTITNTDQAAHLTLVKTVVNAHGGTAANTEWMLAAGGPTPITGVTGTSAVTGVPVSAGAYILSESGGRSGYSASAWVCTAGTLDGASLTLALNQSATCTITNTDQAAHLTLVKTVVNTHGGTAANTEWMLAAGGPTPFSGTTGTNAVVNAGTYTLSESGGPAGYSPSAWVCGDVTVGSNDQVTLALGQSATCTITNTDLPAHLTLVKTVVNENGGTALAPAWTLAAAGPTPFSGATGTSAVTGIAVNAGTYTLSESGGPSGYSPSAWVCTAGTLEGASLTLALNQSATCTITNTDLPAHLTLLKEVVNTHGGTALASAWTLAAAGPTPFSGTTGTNAVVKAGTYTLSESGGPSGYGASAWVCTAGTLEGASLTLALNQSATCTITNTDQAAHLTLVKGVVNTHGGTALNTAWTLAAAGPTPFSGVTGSSAVTGVTVNAGTYTLSESGPSGYGASEWVCTAGTLAGSQLTLALNQSATCTITNSDLLAHLTLVKVVVNGQGGTAVATDWTLSAAGPITISGTTGSPAVTGAALPAGDFKLSEAAGPTDYTASGWVCVGGTLNGATLTLGLAQSVTCTITNTQDEVQVLGVSETAPTVAGASQSLAFTGAAGILPLGIAGLLALALGAVLTAAARRRVRS